MTERSEAETRVMSGEAWVDFCDTLKDAGRAVLDPTTPATVLDRAEGWRYLSRLASWAITSHVEYSDPDFPVIDYVDSTKMKIGADNPDSLYALIHISGDRDYVLRGKMGNAPYMTFGAKGGGFAAGVMLSSGEIDARDLHIAPDGTFEIIVSQNEPANGKDWLRTTPESSSIVIRENHYQYERRERSRMTIERIGGPQQPQPLSAEAIDGALRRASRQVGLTASGFAAWTEMFRKHVNQMPAQDQTLYWKSGGDPNIHYIHGYWELAPDEALVIDTKVPECRYWNFVLQDYWMCSLDYRHFPVWYNHETAKLNADGSVTFVIAAEDVGLGNWLDTAGHSLGTTLLRWVNAQEHPTPTCRVAKIADLKADVARRGV